MLNAPDTYRDKIAIGGNFTTAGVWMPSRRQNINAPPRQGTWGVRPRDITALGWTGRRHELLIAQDPQVRAAGKVTRRRECGA